MSVLSQKNLFEDSWVDNHQRNYFQITVPLASYIVNKIFNVLKYKQTEEEITPLLRLFLVR